MNMQSQKDFSVVQKESFQLRSLTGRVVLTFDNQERAADQAKTRKLRLFQVTTIEKELAL